MHCGHIVVVGGTPLTHRKRFSKSVAWCSRQKERRDELIRLESENADSRFVVDPQRGPQVRSDSVVEPDGPQERSGANSFDSDVVVGTFRQ